VKAVRNVQAKKKVYMLYEIPAARDVTGGPWYNGQDFDTEFVARVQQTALRALTEKVYANVEEVAAFIQATGVVKVPLSLDDIQTILNTLVYDGRIEETKDPRPGAKRNAVMYKLSHVSMPNFLTQIPCGKCPVFDLCGPEGDINPNNCVYFAEWLSF